MTTQLVSKGKATWVGSGAPNRSRVEPSKLKVRSGAAYAFDKHPSPVPYGDTVGVAVLRFWVAKDFTGTVTLKARRVADRPDWGDLTWSNKPGVTGTSQPTVTLTNPVKGTLVEFSVATHLQTVANGGGKEPHYGWRIESDNATPILLWGFDSDFPPELYVEYSNKPATPTDLTTGLVAVAKPVLSFTAPDGTGDDDVSAVRFQFDAASDPVSPDFDTAWVPANAAELDMAGTAWTGLATTGASTFWRAAWKASAGIESAWSDWYPITRLDRRTITLTNPPVGGTVTDVTPNFLATVDGPITHYRIRVVDPDDPKTIRQTSGKRPATGTTISWTPPKPLREIPHRVQFDVWDDEDRAATAGEPTYTRAARTFTVVDGAPATPTGVTAAQVGGSPAVQVTWTYTGSPDTFTLYDNGEPVVAGIDPDTALVAGSTYSYTWSGSTPQVPHAYRVRAVQNGDQSPKSAAATVTPQVRGIWIVDADRDLSFVIGGKDVATWRYTDQVGTYQVLGGSTVHVFAGANGIAGTCTGPMRDRTDEIGRTLTSLENDLWKIKKRRGRQLRLVLGDMSIPVVLLNLSCTIDENHNSEWGPRRLVSFGFTSDEIPAGAS